MHARLRFFTSAFLCLLGAGLGHGETTLTSRASVAPAAPPSPLADFVASFAAATGIRLVPIPAGSFLLGSPPDEALRENNEGPPTRVTFTKDFYLAATTVTQAQWTAVMGTSPSPVAGATLPVGSVS